MKKIITFCLIVTATILFVSTSAMALPDIYEGTELYDGVFQSGTQDDGESRSGIWDFWGFWAEAGDIVDVVGYRPAGSTFDSVISLYQGTTDSKEGFLEQGDFGGMTFIEFDDDDGDNGNGYGYRDSYINDYSIETAGYYTVAVTGYSSSTVGQNYEVMVTGNTVAPEPVSSVLFVIGGTVLGFRKRFFKKKEVLAV